MPGHQAHSLGSDFLVCPEAGSTPFADDLEGVCADCGRTLSFRPYLAGVSPKLCRGCFGVRKQAAIPSEPGRKHDA